MKAYLARQGIKHTVNTPYHAQANSRVEQINGFVVQDLAKLSAVDPTQWKKYLPTALMMSCTRINQNTSKSPYKLMFGRTPKLISTNNRTKLNLLSTIPNPNSNKRKQVLEEQLEKENKSVKNKCVELTHHLKVGEELWMINLNKFKL